MREIDGLLSSRDLRDAADACEIRAEELEGEVVEYFDSRGDPVRPEHDRYQALAEKLRVAALVAVND